MSEKKNKKTFSTHSESLTPTKLNTSAVDRLVEAHKGDASGVEKSEVKKFHKGKLDKIPAWIKGLFVKWWFIGAFCFFFLWGLGNYVSVGLDQIFVLGLATGVLTDLLTNNFLRLLETYEGEYDNYMLITARKKFWTLFVNIVYGFVCTYIVVSIYNGINIAIINAKGLDPAKDALPLGVGPILYGLFYLIIDMSFIGFRNLGIKIFRKKEIY